MREVRVIQPIAEQVKKLRVAAYARVSSDSTDQLNSFATQVHYYTDYIQSQEEWEFAGMYADEAVTGICAEKREDFQRLIEDCRAGKIDRVIVKSISRFARNTLDCIQTVRELSMLGVSVEFEKEHIDTGKMGSEMLLSILGAAAQEESLSISNNLKWSYRKRMKSGDFITCSAPLGYSLKDNQLVPDPREVPIIKYIFDSYLVGKGVAEIASELNKTETQLDQKDRKYWQTSTILYILRNEKYIGDSLVQKKFTTESIPFQRKRNDGQLSKYYIKDSHPAIISREVFDTAQQLLNQRSLIHMFNKGTQESPFSKVIQCGLCGSTFQRRTYGDQVKWVCYHHLKDSKQCLMKAVWEEEISQAYLKVYHKLTENKETILKPMLDQLRELQDKSRFSKSEQTDLNGQITELVKQNHSLARLQTKGCIDSAIFIERCNRNNRELEHLREELRKLRETDTLGNVISDTELLIDLLEEPMSEFQPAVFKSMVDKIIVYPKEFHFHLKNGLILKEGRE